jgi:hypothetical protein
MVLLSGCLFTKDPALDESNSIAAVDSPEFRVIYQRAGKNPDADPALGEDARVMVLDGLVVLQSWSAYVGQYGYVGYGLLGERAAVCVPKLNEEVDIAAVAASFGVSADVAAEDRSERPPDIHAEGGRDAMRAFVRDLFVNYPLVCAVAAPAGS